MKRLRTEKEILEEFHYKFCLRERYQESTGMLVFYEGAGRPVFYINKKEKTFKSVQELSIKEFKLVMELYKIWGWLK